MGLGDFFKKMIGLRTDDSRSASGVSVEVCSRPAQEDTLQKLTNGLGHMLEHLDGIQTNLKRQVDQNEKLINNIDKLPDFLGAFPEFTKSQKKAVDAVLEQVKGQNERNSQLIEAINRLPQETQKHTVLLSDIKDNIKDSEEVHGRMLENFMKFNDSLECLNGNSSTQNENIEQLSRTYEASERYFKYMFEKQNRRFMWFFAIASVISILCLAGAGVLMVLLVKG